MGLFEQFKKKGPNCIICCGSGRIKVKKGDFPLNFTIVEERCQICEGKGWVKK